MDEMAEVVDNNIIGIIEVSRLLMAFIYLLPMLEYSGVDYSLTFKCRSTGLWRRDFVSFRCSNGRR
jgi:hypothetical protein